MLGRWRIRSVRPWSSFASRACVQTCLQAFAILRPHANNSYPAVDDVQVLQETVAGTKLDADAALAGLRQLAQEAEARLRRLRASKGLDADAQQDAASSGWYWNLVCPGALPLEVTFIFETD